MSDPNVSSGDMPTPPLDPNTADRLLSGSIHPDDAPDGYRRVAALVAAAREPATAAERAEPPAGLAELITSTPPAAQPRTSRRRFAAVAVAATVLLSASGAAAATNNLPAPVQRAVSDLGSHLGLSIPVPEEPSGSTEPEPEPGVVGVETPSTADSEDVGERIPDLEEQLPIDPRSELVDPLVPEPPVTLPTQPAPVNPPVTTKPCALDEILNPAGACVPIDQPSTPVQNSLEVGPLPIPVVPDGPGIPGLLD